MLRDHSPRRRHLLPAVCLLVAAAAGDARAAAYTVTVDARLRTLQVQGCFGRIPDQLVASREAARFLREMRVADRPLDRRQARSGRLLLAAAGAPGCIEYEVEIPKGEDSRWFELPAPSVLLDPRQWLWRPADGPLEIRFRLPEGMAVSVPWPAEGDAYHVPAGETGSATLALGRMQRLPVEVGGTSLRLAVLEASPAADPEVIRHWVRDGARAVSAAYGCFPVEAPQVLVVPVGAADEPVPWGEVQRGGGAAAHLFVDQTRDLPALRNDWVLVHELSHFLHPDFDRDSAWLAEGLASYYQNVLRARAGLMDKRAAWQDLHAGFGRGRAQTRRGVTLLEATRRMRIDHEYMRVYWSGAAIALLADLAYRDAGRSLDEALFRFRECCGKDAKEWSAEAFLATLDRLLGVDAASRLLDRFGRSDRFPDLDEAYVRLGLVADGNELRMEAPGAALREAIMNRPGAWCDPAPGTN